MSLRVGLGASQADLDVQGEIDFDFFDENDSINTTSNLNSSQNRSSPSLLTPFSGSDVQTDNLPASEIQRDLNVTKVLEPAQYFSNPLITVSCDDLTGIVHKTTIETVIPTPFNYKDNKCGARKCKKIMLSPKLKSKAFIHDQDISDDSSLSSMSESESELSATDDSVNFNEDSDSMTDVTPLMSPFKCYSPLPNASKRNSRGNKFPTSRQPKEGVKFPDKLQDQECPKCQAIDINELLKAVKRLEVGKEVDSAPKPKSACTSTITQNMKCRRNLTFSNEEVRRIDKDNSVLLNKIKAQKSRSKPQQNATVKTVSSATVNRQKNRRSIELENLALLKRLKATKASKELRRDFLLKEYESRSAGVLSRTSSRAAKTNSSRTSTLSSGRLSAVSAKSGATSASSVRTMKS